MSMAARVKRAGATFLGFAFMVGMMAIGIGVLMGAAAFSIWVLKLTFPAFAITFLASLFLLAPLSLIPAARGVSAVGFMIAYFIFSVSLWLFGMAYTYTVWGIFGVIFGLMLAGVGVVPIAMLASLLHGDWGNLGAFIFAAIVTISSKMLSIRLAQMVDERSARLDQYEIIVPARRIQNL